MAGLPVRWEDRPEVRANPRLVEDFKRAYEDHSLTLGLICANFSMSSSEVAHAVARRLGLTLRLIQRHRTPEKLASTSLTTVEDEIEKVKNQLAQLEQKKLDLTVRAERRGTMVTIYGLSEPVTREVVDLVRWLKAGGPQKIRQLIQEEEWK